MNRNNNFECNYGVIISTLRNIFLFLRTYCKGNERYLVISICIIVVNICLDLPFPLIFRYYIDNVIIKGQSSEIFKFSLIFVFAVCLKNASTALNARSTFLFREKTFIALQRHIFREALMFKYRYYEANNTGYVVSRLHNEVQQLQDLFWDTYIGLFTQVTTIVVGVYAVFTINRSLAVFSVLPIPIYFFIFLKMNLRIKKINEVFTEQYSIFYGFLWETISKIIPTIVLDLRELKRRQLDEQLNSIFLIKKSRVLTSAVFTSFVTVIGGLSPIIVLCIGGGYVVAQEMSLGDLIAFNAFLGFIYNPIANILTKGTEITAAAVAFKRISEILSIDKYVYGECIIGRVNELHINNLSFSYGNETTLKNIDLKFTAGEKVGICGHNGSGKTTMVKLLLGLYDDYEGEILLNGIELRKIKNRRDCLGVLPQDYVLFATTVRENIKYGNIDGDDKKIDLIAAELNMSFVEGNFSSTLGTKINAESSGISGGERQKVLFARVLFQDPDIIIIDEGTSSLDAQNKECFDLALNTRNEHKIVIMITHDNAILSKCDRVIHLCDGRVVKPEQYIEWDGSQSKESIMLG